MRSPVVILGCLGCSAAIVLAVTVGAASADPVTVGTGNISLIKLGDAQFTLNGSGFAATGDLGGADNPGYDAPGNCYRAACSGGFNLSIHDSLTSFTPEEQSNLFVSGTLIFGGQSYKIDSFTYNISAPVSFSNPGTGTASSPFTFTGSLTGTGASGHITVPLTGGGTASATYETQDGWVGSGYTFTSVSATPEPATLLLLGTGVMGVYARRRLARKQD